MSPSFLSDLASEQIAIGLSLVRWASRSQAEESQSQKPSLDEGIIYELSVRAGGGKITKQDCVLSVEEILDLLFHTDNLLSRKEDQFEWSTVEPTVQMLQLSREAEIIHVQLLLKLSGYPEGYAGNASLSFQFDAKESGLRGFQGGMRAQLLSLLGEDEKALNSLIHELEAKIRLIRSRKNRAH